LPNDYQNKKIKIEVEYAEMDTPISRIEAHPYGRRVGTKERMGTKVRIVVG